MVLVSKLRRDAVLWWPYTGPRRLDRRTLGSRPHIHLSEEGLRLYPAQLYYKSFKQLLQVVFVLAIEADPAETTPTALSARTRKWIRKRSTGSTATASKSSSTSAMPRST